MDRIANRQMGTLWLGACLCFWLFTLMPNGRSVIHGFDNWVYQTARAPGQEPVSTRLKSFGNESGESGASLNLSKSDWQVMLQAIGAERPQLIVVAGQEPWLTNATPTVDGVNIQTITWATAEDSASSSSTALDELLTRHWPEATGTANQAIAWPAEYWAGLNQGSLRELYEFAQFEDLSPFIKSGDVVIIAESTAHPQFQPLINTLNSAATKRWLAVDRQADSWPWFSLIVAVAALALFFNAPASIVFGVCGLSVAAALASGPLFDLELAGGAASVPLVGSLIALSLALQQHLRQRQQTEDYRVLGDLLPDDQKATFLAEWKNKDAASDIVVTALGVEFASYRKDQVTCDLQEQTEHVRQARKAIYSFFGQAGVPIVYEAGLLTAYVGIAGSKVADNHPGKALQLATSLMEKTLELYQADPELKQQPMPIRVGVHTGVVQAKLTDKGFTLTGSVPQAVRDLTNSCEWMYVMLSESAADAIRQSNLTQLQWPKRELTDRDGKTVRAVEIHPIPDSEKELRDFIRSFNQAAARTRQHERLRFTDEQRLTVSVGADEGSLIDFSMGGLQLKLTRFLANGETITLTLDPDDILLANDLIRYGLLSLQVEVRWGRAGDDGFYHGLRVVDLDTAQKEILFSLLKNVAEPSSGSGDLHQSA